MIHKLDEDCFQCSLRQGAKQVVWGDGPEDPRDADIMYIGEAPGRDENRAGYPFMGMSGREFDHLNSRNGIQRSKIYVTNVVKCRPPGNRDPKDEEIETCKHWLYSELDLVKPRIVVAVGRFATRLFLPEANMEMVHGIPFDMDTFTLIPVFHIAAGLHDPGRMMYVQDDFRAVRDVVAGHRLPRHVEDPHAGKETYERITIDGLRYLISTRERDVIAIDTEYGENGPLCLTFSFTEGSAFLIDAESRDILAVLNEFVSDPAILTVLHNAVYDLPNLEVLGIFPAKVACTMVMAYLLQNEPQGLKPLAYRHLGMDMFSYKEVVRNATRHKAVDYLKELVYYNWPDAEPVLEWPKGEPHIRQPQNIVKKAARILKDMETKDVDPYSRWYKIPELERDWAEACLGKMYEGNLSDVDKRTMTIYACRDADATIRLYDVLWPRIQQDRLERTFWIDMDVIPMAIDMHKTGIRVNIPYMEELSSYFQEKLDEIESQINRLTGKAINPSSHEQVADLLFKTLKLKPVKKTKKGKPSTAEEVLSRMVDPTGVVKLIQDHREMAKLKGTYTEKIPAYAREDGRVHGDIRLTRTATGRLSMANPNLQNQPVRSEEGRKIRKGFIASDGCSLVSSDYSQIELRMMAHMSQDPLMLEIFRRGDDIHAITASKMFGVPIANLDKMLHRYPAKRTNFGIAYDISAQGLYRDFQIAGAKGWTVEKCQELINEWFKLYKGVAAWKKTVVQQARLNGYVMDMFGRRRYVPAVRCADQYLHEKALREGGNMPIQAGAQGVIKIAMGDLWPYVVSIRSDGFTINILIQIHDDLLFEIDNRILYWAVPLIKNIMESAVELRIPTPVDPEVGQNWAEMEKWKEAA